MSTFLSPTQRQEAQKSARKEVIKQELDGSLDKYENQINAIQGEFEPIYSRLLELCYTLDQKVRIDGVSLRQILKHRFGNDESWLEIAELMIDLAVLVGIDLDLEQGFICYHPEEGQKTALCLAGDLNEPDRSYKTYRIVTGKREQVVEKLLRAGAKTSELNDRQMAAIQHIVDRINI